MPPLAEGALVGRVQIPRLGVSVMVLEGDDEAILQKAAGHVPSSALPSATGNVVIAGHRDSFFRPLRGIRKGDEIRLTTREGIYRYQVDSMEKVMPDDVRVLRASARPTLTLITCYPFNYIGAAPMRFVVAASAINSPGAGALLASNIVTPEISPASLIATRHQDAIKATIAKPVKAPVQYMHLNLDEKQFHAARATKASPTGEPKMAAKDGESEPDDAEIRSASKKGKVRGLWGFISRPFRSEKSRTAERAAESD